MQVLAEEQKTKAVRIRERLRREMYTVRKEASRKIGAHRT